MDCAGHSAAMRTKYIRGLEAMHSALDQIQSLQHKIRQLEHNEPTASKGLSSVSEGHIRILETSLSKAQSDLIFAKKELQLEKKLTQELQEKLRTADEIVSKKFTEIEILKHEISSVTQNQLKNAESEKQQLQDGLANANTKIAELNMTLLSISRERDDLQKNVLDYHKIIKDSTARVEKLTAEKQDIIDRADGLKHTNSRLDAEIERLKSVVVNYRLQRTTVDDLKKKLARAEEDKCNTTKLMRKLKEDLKHSRKIVKVNEESKTKIYETFQQRQKLLELQVNQANAESEKISLHLQNELIYNDRLREQLQEAQEALSKYTQMPKVAQNANFGKYLQVKAENQRLVQKLKGIEKAKKPIGSRPTAKPGRTILPSALNQNQE